MASNLREKKQTILVGLGGTGSRVVNNVARMLKERKHSINDGKITCVVFDTNQEDNKNIMKSGTDIPVIPTCDDKKIREYFDRYANMRVREWCPTSPSFEEENMIDGASEVRVKSRLAFMDTLEDGGIRAFISEIEKVFHNRADTREKLRVLVVASLAGGTGSGMFIQMALWLRQFFENRNCECTIRGILLLPDIFVSTLENAQNNPRKKLYYYANAYAAIREVNAINKVVKEQNKVQKGGKPVLERPMIIDGLFDSRKPPKKPVFDNAFFVDNEDANGAPFSNISQYEDVAAQMVYMQLYAPMHSEMISVEDNLYRSFEANPEPVYGSCGTAKIEYPTMDVVRYCALRAAADSISQGWYCLDNEIEVLKTKLENKQKDGQDLDSVVCVGDEYIRLFNEKSGKTKKDITANDRLFVRIKNDVNLIERKKDGDRTYEVPTCKVASFMSKLTTAIASGVEKACNFDAIDEVVANLASPEKLRKGEAKVTKTLIEKCKKLRTNEVPAVQACIDEFDGTDSRRGKKGAIVEAIIRKLVPMDMGSITMNNDGSVYGLFLSKDVDNKETVVHPVAARYLLYKLQQRIKAEQAKLLSDSYMRQLAIEGDKEVSFDISGTKNVQESRDTYFDQVGWVVDRNEMAFYIEKYKQHNQNNKILCMDYCKNAVAHEVLKELSEYVASMITQMEALFAEFKAIQKELDKNLVKNIEKNLLSETTKVLYVYAQPEHKEEMYKSLNIDPFKGDKTLNKSVVDAVYGRFCAENMPSSDDNKKYVEYSVQTLVYDALVNAYEKEVKEAKDKINLSIMGAIRNEVEFEETEDSEQDDNSYIDNVGQNDADENESVSSARERRFREAVAFYKKQLIIRSAPFLKTMPDQALANPSHIDGVNIEANGGIWMTTEEGQRLFMPYQTELTFWGFRRDLLEEMDDLDKILGANKDTSCSNGYRRNELCCYRSIYGVVASKIDKFNEMTGGDYYAHYSAVINTMIETGSEIATPHLDKTWHEFLPYVSPERQEEAQRNFGVTFWRALAYGRITLDNHDKYQLAKKVKDSFGNENLKHELLLDENGNPIAKTDICRLVKALRSHPDFNAKIVSEMKELYEKELQKGITKYEGTDIFGNLLRNEEINPIALMTQFQHSRNYDEGVKMELLGALQWLVADLVDNLDVNRTGVDSAERSLYQQLYKLYDACTQTKKSLVVPSNWIEKFQKYGLLTAEKAKADKSAAAAEANADEEAE